MITIIIILIITAVIFFVVKKWKSNEEFYDGLKEREVQLEKEILEHYNTPQISDRYLK